MKRSIAMGVSVCLSVCLSVCSHVYLKNHSPNFTKNLYVAAAQSSSVRVAICFVVGLLPVL